MMGDTLVGVVTLYALRSEAFTRRQVEIIEGVASHLAPILRRRKSVGHSARPLLDGHLPHRTWTSIRGNSWNGRHRSHCTFGACGSVATQLLEAFAGCRRSLRKPPRRGLGFCVRRTHIGLPDCRRIRGHCEGAGDRIIKASNEPMGPRLSAAVVSLPEHGSTLAALLDRAELALDCASPARAVS